MKRRLWVASATILTTLLVSGSALAGGWGPYFSWGREMPSAGFPDSVIDEAVGLLPPGDRASVRQLMEGVDVDFKLDHFTIGVLYESAPKQDTLMSYRGTLGLNITKAKLDDLTIPGLSSLPPLIGSVVNQAITLLGDIDDTGLGFSTRHTLAFRLISNDSLKWWAGPGVGLTFSYYNVGGPLDFKAANLGIGGGGETGVNLHLASGMSLAFSAGIHWNAYGYAIGSGDVGSFVWGDGPLYFIQTSLLFRSGPDRYGDHAQ